MPPLPTIADVFRIVLPWSTFAGITPRNVFNVRCTDTSDVTEIAQQIGGVFTASGPNCFNVMNSNFHFIDINITPLDGATASSDVRLEAEVAGVADSEILPAVATLVKFKTAQRGPRGRGRMYVGPCCENNVVNGSVSPANLLAMGNSWTAFIEDLLLGSPSIEFGVASYLHSDFHPLTSVLVEQVLGTQRRRQGQLR